MRLTRPRRSIMMLLGVVPLSAAFLAAPGAAASDVAATDAYQDVELQARSNLLVNDDGYNLPRGSSFNSITPDINADADIAFRVQYVADTDPTIGMPGLWAGGHGSGEIVHTGEVDWMIPGDVSLNDHGDVAFTLSSGGTSNQLYVYDAESATAGHVGTAPILPNSYRNPGLDNDNNIGFQAIFASGRSFGAFRDGEGIFYASDNVVDPDSPYTYLYTPSYNNAGQIAAKVATSDDLSSELEIRLFEPDGTSTLLLANQAVDPDSPYRTFDNSLGLNDEGVITVVARRAADNTKVLVRTDGTTTTEIAEVDAQGTIRSIEFFPPDINNAGQVVFRAVDPDGQAIYVADGEQLVRVVGKGDIVEVDLGTARLGQHDSSPVFGGAPSINDNGDVVFTAGVHPEDDNLVEWGTGVFVAYGSGETPSPGASEEIVATVPEDSGPGSLILSVDPDDRTVVLPELASAGDRLQTSGELRPVTVTDTRRTDPGWDVSAQVSDFASETSTFGGGFLGWSPTVGSHSAGQDVTPGESVVPGFPTGEGLSVPRSLASATAGNGLGSAELGAGLDLEVPTDTPAGVYRALLTITAI